MAHRLSLSSILAIALLCALPALSQSGRIAFQRDGLHGEPANIVVMPADGSMPGGELGTHKDVSYPRVTPSLSPDGTRLAFSAKVGARFKIFTWQLSEQNTVVGEPKCLTAVSTTSDKFPVWSPDGTKIAYLAVDDANKASLRVMDADGTNQKVVAEVIGYHAAPSWRPNGHELLAIDVVEKKPVLKNILAMGGLSSTIRQDLQIVSAAWSPDGTKIAAIVRAANGLCDLWIIPPFGADSKRLVDKISGVKSVSWPAANAIIFNAVKVGAQSNKAFWVVDPVSKELKGVTGYAAPTQIGYFSARWGAGDGMPTIADGVTPGLDGTGPRERVPTGPVTIMRPLADTVARGVIPIKVIAQQDVDSIVLSIDNKFVYASVVQIPDDAPPHITYDWNTQQFIDYDPVRGGLPARYQDLLRYPDGEYTLRAQGLDKNHKLLGSDQIKVKVRNQLPDAEMPANLVLKLRYVENQSPDERYDIKGEGQLFGVSTSLAPNLAATLNATIRRNLIEVRSTGSATFRSFILQKNEEMPLSYAMSESTIPETRTTALYTVSPSGEIDILNQQFDKIYLPLSLLSVPFPLTPVRSGVQWTGRMWLVADLMERQATSVRVNDVLEGLEWIGDRKTVRIRSDYGLDRQVPGLKLATSPLTTLPGMRETQGLGRPTGVSPLGSLGATQGGTPAVDADTTATASGRINIKEATGIRYSWFDYERRQLLRVEDIILYEFPITELVPTPAPPPPSTTSKANDPFGRSNSGRSGNTGGNTTKPAAEKVSAWYLVRYTYTALPPAD